jgi:Sulfotransferase family
MPEANATGGTRCRKQFFILGAARSGTSLLSRMLNSHPAIAVHAESKVMETFVPLLPFYGDLRRPSRRRRLVDDILSWRGVRHLPNLPESDEVLEREKQKLNGFEPGLGSVFNALWDLWAERQNATAWGAKSPNDLYFWPFIEATLPSEAVVVHIVRDGRDVALSHIKAPFGPKTVATAAERWVEYVRETRAIGERIGPDRYAEIHYEDLLSRPHETLERVLRLLDEPFEPAVLRFFADPQPIGTDPVNEVNVHRPLQVANTSKWKSTMKRGEIEVFEGIGGATLQACGYPRATTMAPMGRVERAVRCRLGYVPRKAVAMMRNRSGIAEALEVEGIRWRLVVNRLSGQLPSTVVGVEFIQQILDGYSTHL